ncbi:MAG: SH3 domain-containing protein [Eubacteriales bacterium]|nr:SH3 domain-containing protein [Eubacteriales bacterium]
MNVRNEKVRKLISGFAAALGCMVIAGSLFMASPMKAEAVVIGSDPNGTSAPADNTGSEDENSADTDGEEEAGSVNGASTGSVTSVTVTKDNVNVRGDASTSASAVGKASSGMELTVSGEKQDSEGKTWYAVTLENNGSSVNGYIREDMVEVHVTETAPAEEEPASEEQPSDEVWDTPQPVVTDDYTVAYEDDGTGSGTSAWYLHDNTMGNKYKVSELLSAQEINQSNQELMDQQTGKLRMIIVAMAVVILILIVVVTVFILKLRNAYDDDDYDDDDDDDYDDDDEEDEEEEEEMPRRRRFGRLTSRRDEEEDEEEDEDDEEDDVEEYRPKRKAPVSKTVKEKPSRRSRYEEDEEEEDDEEEYRPRRSAKSSKSQSDKNWQSKNFLDDDDLEFEFLDLK